MIFCAKNKRYNKNETKLKVDGVSVDQVDETKFLGVRQWKLPLNITSEFSKIGFQY